MIYELRRYTLHPGRRDTLIELFEREFIEGQEAAGMGLPGQFRALDAPDLYPWLRSFPDMESRRAALAAFYGGAVWKANRDAANATLIDSDDVLLLHPVHPVRAVRAGRPDDSYDPFPERERPPAGATAIPPALYVATICHVEEGFAGFFAGQVAAGLAEQGAPPIACFETEHAENTYPALPVREGEDVFVWFTRFDRVEDEHVPDLSALDGRLTAPPERLRLSPTARSALR